MEQGKFITDGVIEPSASNQAVYTPRSWQDTALGYLDDLGGVANDFIGNAGASYIADFFGTSPKSNLTDGSIAVDQTKVLGDAKINQDTKPTSFLKANWMYIAGGVVALGALVFVIKK